jgi:nitrite reductase/ring-hydroxylating ferredoxin subunit
MSRANTKGDPPFWSRRDFARCGCCVVGASCLGLLSASSSAAGLLQEPLAIDLGDPGYTDLRTVGGAVKIDVDGRDLPVMLVRVDEETVIALSTYCTHWGCEVDLPDEDGLIICRCHGTRYGRRGQLIDGPALDDLAQILIQVTFPTAVSPNGWAQVKKTGSR